MAEGPPGGRSVSRDDAQADSLSLRRRKERRNGRRRRRAVPAAWQFLDFPFATAMAAGTGSALGPLAEVDLVPARTRAAEVRRRLHEGRDPLGERATKTAKERIGHAPLRKQPTSAQWPSGTTRRMSRDGATQAPAHGETRADDSAPIRACRSTRSTPAACSRAKPIWSERRKPRRGSGAASKRCSRRRAPATSTRTASNPARWKGHLDQILPKPKNRRSRGNHAAMHYASSRVHGQASRPRRGGGRRSPSPS